MQKSKRPSVPLPPSGLLNIGHYHQPPDSDPIPCLMTHDVERVELVTDGRGWLEIDGRWTEVTAGALLWHVEGERMISRSDWANPYRCLAVNFKTHGFTGVRRAPRLSWWRDIEEVRHFTREIVQWHVDEQFDREALLAYIYGRLIFQVRLWEHGGRNARLPAKLRQAIDILESQCATPISLRDVAQSVGWSVAHLHEVCQSRLGQSPHQILLQRRMRLARERLAATDQPVKQIALECGFSTVAGFCHAFKARVGQTPLNYRRQEMAGSLGQMPLQA